LYSSSSRPSGAASIPLMLAGAPGTVLGLPSRSSGAQTEARVSGVKASAPSASLDHTSV